MKKNKFTDSQILSILKEHEQGATAKDLARRHGFHYQTLYDWKKRFSGVENVSQLARLRELEAENTKLKRLYAERCLEIEAMKDVLSKKW